MGTPHLSPRLALPGAAAPSAAVLAAALLSAALPAGGTPTRLPTTAADPRPVLLAHPARPGAPPSSPAWERAQVNAACEACHEDIAAEWRASRHRAAFTNAPFQASLAREPPPVRPFCQGCHAPDANPLLPPPALAASMGVGCVTCHAPQGPVLAAPAAPGDRTAPHAVLRTALLGADDACAGCHEFPFPGRSGQGGLAMQRTVTEHLATADGRTCQSCHMPLTAGPRPHRSHAFPGGHDPEMVRSALAIHAERTGPTRVRLALSPTGATHAVPTGDLFRRLAVEVTGDPGAPPRLYYLARHFDRDGGRMRETRDDRVQELTRALDIDVSPGPVSLVVRYERVAHHRSPDERDAEVEGAVELARLQLR